MKTTFLLPVLSLLAIPLQLIGQSPYDSPNHNRALLKNVPAQNVAYLKASESGHLEQLLYYFSQSFNVSITGCDSCTLDPVRFFNVELFDIATYENLRKETERVSFAFKDIYMIELLSATELSDALHLDAVNPEELFSHVPDEGLPKWKIEWQSEHEFNRYRQNVDFYILRFPDQYNLLSTDPGFISMKYSTFKSLSQEEKLSILEHHYELIK